MVTRILRYDPSKLVDIKEFMAKYSDSSLHELKMLKGTPILVNVDGSYVKESDLASLTVKMWNNNSDYDILHWDRDQAGRIKR